MRIKMDSHLGGGNRACFSGDMQEWYEGSILYFRIINVEMR